MSTRANIIIKDDVNQMIFYRHSDGYPEGTMPSLEKFLDLVKSKTIRDNVSQSAGWLIVIGHEEYAAERAVFPHTRWKIGAYEPTNQIHGDIDYLYTIDLKKQTITVEKK